MRRRRWPSRGSLTTYCRSAATGMARLGVQPHIIESILNHMSGFRAGVAGTYNREPYEAEKRAALDLWGKHISKLCR
jgi:hypothetical protein